MRVLVLRPSTSMLTEDLTCVPPCPPLHVLCDPRCPTCPLLLPVAPWSDHQDPGQSASQLPSAHMHSVVLSPSWAFLQHGRPPHPLRYL